mgnify:CR=1 FL=1
MDIDFSAVNQYQVPMGEFAANLSIAELRAQTVLSIDRFLALLASCVDEDVVFVPHDPEAYDAYAAKFRPEEAEMGWTIAHNVVHATASGEEYAFNAAELVRGVPYHGRSRYEMPWQSVTTVAQCVARLEESRRIRLATLDAWPAQPDLENGVTPWRQSGWVNGVGLFSWGLAHDQSHIAQIEKILRQIK